eukprot:4288229-Pleurochrysis_carterae.AAC.1
MSRPPAELERWRCGPGYPVNPSLPYVRWLVGASTFPSQQPQGAPYVAGACPSVTLTYCARDVVFNQIYTCIGTYL